MRKSLLILIIFTSLLATKNIYSQTFSVTVNIFTTFGGTNISLTPYVIQAYRDSAGLMLLEYSDTVMSGTTSTMTFVSNNSQYRFKYVAPFGSPNQDSWSDGIDMSANGILSWQNAATFWDSVGVKTPYINVQGFNPITPGSSTINGVIVEGNGFFKGSNILAPGNPIGGIIVKGGKNPGGQIFAQTVTNASGQYTFANLSSGNYFVMVDAPGYDTTACHYVSISSGETVNGIDYTIGTAGVVPTTLSSVKEFQENSFDVKLFPNPTRQILGLCFDIDKSSKIKIDLLSLDGKLVKELQLLESFHGTFNHQFILDLKPGSYFVRTTVNDVPSYSQLVITP